MTLLKMTFTIYSIYKKFLNLKNTYFLFDYNM